jgi:myo-inositol-1-phosphate synthase
MEGCGNRVLCRNLFKKLQMLPLTSQDIQSLLMFVVQNKNFFSTNNENHNLDTRQRNNLYLPQANLTIYQKAAYYSGIQFFNNLPLEIKNVAGDQKKFKNALKIFL